MWIIYAILIAIAFVVLIFQYIQLVVEISYDLNWSSSKKEFWLRLIPFGGVILFVKLLIERYKNFD